MSVSLYVSLSVAELKRIHVLHDGDVPIARSAGPGVGLTNKMGRRHFSLGLSRGRLTYNFIIFPRKKKDAWTGETHKRGENEATLLERSNESKTECCDFCANRDYDVFLTTFFARCFGTPPVWLFNEQCVDSQVFFFGAPPAWRDFNLDPILS